MATKRKTASRKTTSRKRATKPTRPKKERPPKEDLCVFALRMTAAERAKLHETAGPRGASRLARAVLAAFANEDSKAFEAAIREARVLRG